MKLNVSFESIDAANSINDFLARKMKNLRLLLAHTDFRAHFALNLAIKVSKFDLEVDQLNSAMYLPTTQIIYDADHNFTELVLSF